MFFYTFLPKLLNMSLTASVVIVLVLLLRLLLKKAPKVISYALWGIVLFRLICPVSIESSFSLFGLLDTPVAESGTMASRIEYVPNDIVHTEYPNIVLPVPGFDDAINNTLPQGEEQLRADPLEAPMAIATYVWMVGVIGMGIYAALSYKRLRRKLITASPLRENIYLVDDITSPFVMGLFKPKIYLPSSVEEQEQSYILMHEQHHIRRFDYIIKALAFVVLCIHWFNPLVWIAFILAGRDMEMSCDEAVIKKMGDCVLADYTASLLSLATGKHIIAGTPLAFGEGDTKGRIRNLANWKKPAFGIIVVAVVSCAFFAVCLLTNPKQESFRLRIIIPAGSQETVVYADEEISPLGNYITVTADEGLGDTQVFLKPVQVRTETAYDEPAYLIPGMPVKMDAEKGGWFKIGVNVQNNTDEDKIVYVNVDNIEVRIESTILDDIEQYRTDYIGDAPKVSSIAHLLSYPKDFRYSSIELKTQTKPYELIVYLTGNDPVQKKDFDLCAATAFDLIGNMDVITFCKVETGETIASFVQSDFDKVEVYDLDTAINQAILEHFSDENTDGLIHVESHVLLANEAISGTPMVGEDTHIEEETVYLLVLHEIYSTYGGTLESVGGSFIPTAITFEVLDSGEYTLKEYWEPRDGSYYTDDIRDKFPGAAADDALNDQAYIEDLQTQNYSKALACLHSAGSLDTTIEKLLDTIMASPTASSNPSDYTQAHEPEYQELLSYGEYTLRYCFSEFLQGGQTELRGQIMALICQNIMLTWGEGYAIDQDLVTGQDWFDAFKRRAESLDKQYSDEDMEKYYPGSWLLLQIINE